MTLASPKSTNITEKLGLEDELALLVPLGGLERLVVLPPHRLLAATARNVAHDVAARRHATLVGLARLDVDNRVEEVGFSVLAAEVLGCVGQVFGVLGELGV